MIEIVGFAAATLTTIAFLPQLLRILKTRSAKDVSAVMYLVMFAGIILWLIYGFHIHSLPVLAANIVSFIFVVAILLLKLKHK